jgi:hypothetical protein
MRRSVASCQIGSTAQDAHRNGQEGNRRARKCTEADERGQRVGARAGAGERQRAGDIEHAEEVNSALLAFLP